MAAAAAAAFSPRFHFELDPLLRSIMSGQFKYWSLDRSEEDEDKEIVTLNIQRRSHSLSLPRDRDVGLFICPKWCLYYKDPTIVNCEASILDMH